MALFGKLLQHKLSCMRSSQNLPDQEIVALTRTATMKHYEEQPATACTFKSFILPKQPLLHVAPAQLGEPIAETAGTLHYTGYCPPFGGVCRPATSRGRYVIASNVMQEL